MMYTARYTHSTHWSIGAWLCVTTASKELANGGLRTALDTTFTRSNRPSIRHVAKTRLFWFQKVRHKQRPERSGWQVRCPEPLPPTSGIFVQSLALQMPVPSKYFPVTGGHFFTVHVCLPSNMKLMHERQRQGTLCLNILAY